ncbi:Ras and Rab interactor-like protein [Apodemus speciosus]|uniref:Ras and Rab interactor-like protein n=1 Tax=Apodemus speciosus TaxID=105296 RepID=A0ABQ0EXQ4_APOSI
MPRPFWSCGHWGKAPGSGSLAAQRHQGWLFPELSSFTQGVALAYDMCISGRKKGGLEEDIPQGCAWWYTRSQKQEDQEHKDSFGYSSFLVIGHDPGQVLMLKAGPSSGDIHSYQIQKFPGANRCVSLESSNLCMPDFPHLLAFLSASRDILPRTLLLPMPTVGPGNKHSESSSARLHPGGQLAEGAVCSEPALPGDARRLGNRDSTANRARGRPETQSRLAGRGLGTLGDEGMDAPGVREPTCFSPPAPRQPTPHRVSWVEDPPKPEALHTGLGAHHPERQVHYPGPEARSLGPEVHFPSPALEEKEEVDNDGYKDEEEGCEAVLTAHIRALARTRSSYVARQCRCLRARLISDSGNPCSPGDPATELLQDVRQLLTNLQNYLANDPDVRAVFGNRGPSIPREEDLGNGNWRETPQEFKGTMSWSCPAVEVALCRAVLEPLKPALWTKLRTLRAQELRRLRRRQIALRVGAGPEGQSPALRNRIHARLAHLHAACAPRRKVALLLAVCSDVYAGLAGGENKEPLGADAFLPALTEELIWSPHIGETQLDVEFLMELLDPGELRGEAGYYLTTWFGALYHIANYQPDAGRAPQELSSEARASLRQWHRRRTLHQQAQPTAQVNQPFEEPWAIGDP